MAVPFTFFGNFELFVFERDILKQRWMLTRKHIYCVFSNIDSIEQFLRKNILKKSRSSIVHHFVPMEKKACIVDIKKTKQLSI